jgi:hypothetical protein
MLTRIADHCKLALRPTVFAMLSAPATNSQNGHRLVSGPTRNVRRQSPPSGLEDSTPSRFRDRSPNTVLSYTSTFLQAVPSDYASLA